MYLNLNYLIHGGFSVILGTTVETRLVTSCINVTSSELSQVTSNARVNLIYEIIKQYFFYECIG